MSSSASAKLTQWWWREVEADVGDDGDALPGRTSAACVDSETKQATVKAMEAILKEV